MSSGFNKKAQITIFVIIGLIFVISLILLFTLIRGPSLTDVKINPIENPSEYIEDCVLKTVQEPLNVLLKQGGELNPENYVLFNNTKVNYLCYTNEAYKTCVNQYPLYIQHIENELKSYSKQRIEACFEELINNLEKKNYEVIGDSKINNFDIMLKPNEVVINIDKKISYSKNNEQKSFNGFKFKIISSIYDLAKLSQEIVNQESRFCNFEYVGYMGLYPEYDIKKTTNSQGGNIYTLKHYYTKEETMFATRSCYFPPGLV